MRKIIYYCVIFCCLILGACDSQAPTLTATSQYDDAHVILAAYKNQQSNIFVESTGKVKRLLKDDLKGSRHQRFLIQLLNGQTLLVSHNIDIAPRINDLKIGDQIFFRGEYEWNDKGGVIHWTHRDPNGRYLGGWIEHKGTRYF